MANQRDNSAKLLGFAKAMRQSPSDAEKLLWNTLRNRQLQGLKFRRQRPIGPFIADFACEHAKLVVEVDGYQHDSAEAYDQARTDALKTLGWRVIRFSAADVVKDIRSVCHTIIRDANGAGPHPRSSFKTVSR